MPAGRPTKEHWPHKFLPFMVVEKFPEFRIRPLENVSFVERNTEICKEVWTKNPNGGWDIERTFKVDY